MNGPAWLYHKHGHKDYIKPDIPNINFDSWCCSFYLKCNRDLTIKDKFYNLVNEI